MIINRLDHLVLTVRNIETTCEFYSQILGMQVISFEGGRKALAIGSQKINLMRPILSIYLRDPDQNLVEIANYLDKE